jgi:hypothetical protein
VRSVLLPVVLVILASADARATAVWVASIDGTGLQTAEVSDVDTSVRKELAAVGAEVVEAAPADAACAAQAPCLASGLATANAELAFVIRVVRAGPIVQVSTLVVDTSGAEWFREEHVISATELPSAAILPGGLTAKLRETAAASPAAAANGAESSSPEPPAGSGSETSVAGDDDEELPVLGIVGLGVLAAGLGAVVGGAAVAVAGNEVLQDGGASAADKEQAFVYGPIAIGVAVVGGVAALAGAGIAAWGLAVEG